VTPLIAVDRVNYDNDVPWPAPPDGTGPSVGRINAVRYGNDPINWRPDAINGTGGLANTVAPLVFQSGFAYAANGPTVRIKFSKDVGASLVNADLTIRNLTTDLVLDSLSVVFNYDALTQTATWRLPTSLADGNFKATLAANGVVDAQNRPLDGNADGTPGDDFALAFFHLLGDANGDRAVGFADLVQVAQNYDKAAGQTWADGDFDFDGAIGFSDLVAVAQRYDAALSAAGAVVSASPMNSAALAAAFGHSVPATTKATKPPVAKPPVPTVKVDKPVIVRKPTAPPPIRPAARGAAPQLAAPSVAQLPPPNTAGTFANKRIKSGLFD
jgi:hypothetical protein